MAAGRLDGRGILITRPARQAAGLAEIIASIGGVPFIFPAIVILPPADREGLERVQQQLANYDFAVFVSANAVEYAVADAKSWPKSVRVFAPGTGTASALIALGITDVRTPTASMDSEGLLALPELNIVAGKRGVIFRGRGGRELMARTLAARGADVDVVECYVRARPESSAAGLSEALRAGRIDATTLTSREGADNLWSMLDSDARAEFVKLPCFVPHERIAERARSLGIAEVVVTGGPGLIEALLDYFNTGEGR